MRTTPLAYPEYKRTTIPGFVNLPAHWQVARLKSVCKRHSLYGANIPATEYRGSGVRFLRTTDITNYGQLTGEGVHLPAQAITEYILSDGDILLSRSGTVGRSFLYRSEIHGPCAYAGYLVRFVPKTRQIADYIYLFTKTPAFQEFLRTAAISSTIENVNAEKYANSLLPIPPPDEQAAIVRYLGHADELISRYISAKERLIALLEEQRQAVIHHAVTRGLDPDVPIKPSGIDWVDFIPRRWKTRKIQTLSHPSPKSFTDGDWIESPYIASDGIRLIQTGNIGTGQYVEQGYRYISEATFTEFNCTEIAPNDILICRLGDPVARACLAPELGKRMITSVDVCILKPNLDVNAKFAVFVMNSPKYLSWVKSLVRGSTRDRISRSMLSKFPIPSPSLQEQNEIVTYLERATENIVVSKHNAERQIKLINEYRSRLIADVVTGQIDVRDAEVVLPD